MKRIVRGNDFTLRVPVMKIVDGEKVAFPLPGCTDIKVNIVNQYRRIALSYTIDVSEDNVLLARVEGDKVAVGTYALEVKGKLFGNDWRSNEYEQFQLVDNNAAGDTVFEPHEGEDSVEMDTALVVLAPSVELGNLIKDAEETIADTKEAIRNAQTATAEAENVNAELNGNVLTVTNRQGTAKSVNLTDADEHVTVNVTTTLASVSVEGIILNVYINNGADPQQYTTDSNGQAVFTVTKGSTYKVVFPYINGCAILNPVQHVAAVGNRIIDAVYTEETIKFEHVTVRMQKANEDDVLQPWEGASVHVTIGGKKTDYITDAQGVASFDVKIDTTYTVAVDKVDGMYEQYDNYSRTRKAMADSYRFNYAYHYYESGAWLIDDEGKKWTWDAWEASGKDKTHLVFVCIKTLDTQRYGGDIYISIDLLANFGQIPSKQWANQNVQFQNIPLNGTDNSDTQYYKFAYNGLVATITIIAEGNERSIETPFCDYCHSRTVDCAGETWQGYGPTLEQWKLAWANIDYVVDAVNLKFPELGVSVNNYKGSKWTATQYSAASSCYFGAAVPYCIKNGAFLAIPFFACPSPSLSLSLSSEEDASEEGASVDAERVA
jgi:hypothetical protein